MFSGDGWRDALLTPSILLLLAVGQMVVIVTRNVDLSVGSVLGDHGVRHREDLHREPGHPGAAGLPGRAGGSGECSEPVNGFLVAFFRVPALVVTLGTMYAFRGGYLTPDRQRAASWPVTSPADFEKLGTQQVLTIPVLTLIGPGRAGVVGYYLHTARGGRELYAIGSDPDAARLYGLNVGKRVLRRVRAVRRARRPRRRLLRRPLRHGRSPAPAATSSSRPSPPS